MIGKVSPIWPWSRPANVRRSAIRSWQRGTALRQEGGAWHRIASPVPMIGPGRQNRCRHSGCRARHYAACQEVAVVRDVPGGARNKHLAAPGKGV